MHFWLASVWFGALVPLSLLVLRADRAPGARERVEAHYALRRFSSIGSLAVTTLIVTGLINSWFLIGPPSWAALFGTPYGIVLVAKLVCFAFILVLAAANRFWLTPQLRTSTGPLTCLKWSLAGEITLAALLILAVAVLGSLEPPVSAGVGAML